MKKAPFIFALALSGFAMIANAQIPYFDAFKRWEDISNQSWTMKESDKVQLVEEWTLTNDSLYNGRAFNLKSGTDTVVIESLKLVFRNGKTYYEPTIHGKKKDKTSSFVLTDYKVNSWRFENPKHYFPQIIEYSLPHPDTLKAHIHGRIGGEPQHQFFNYIRKP